MMMMASPTKMGFSEAMSAVTAGEVKAEQEREGTH
jgi:hypothetical protein